MFIRALGSKMLVVLLIIAQIITLAPRLPTVEASGTSDVSGQPCPSGERCSGIHARDHRPPMASRFSEMLVGLAQSRFPSSATDAADQGQRRNRNEAPPWLPADPATDRADNIWDQSPWLDKSHINNEHVIGIVAGTEMARSIKRLPKHSQVNAALLDSMRGNPWYPMLTAPRGKPRRQAQPKVILIAPAMVSQATDPVDQTPVIAELVTEGAQPELHKDADVVVERVPADTPPATGSLESVAAPPPGMMDVEVPQQAQTPRRSKRALDDDPNEVLGSPGDNRLKLKADSLNLITMTEEDADTELLDDAAATCDDELIAAARQDEFDNWDKFKVAEVMCAKQAAKSGHKMLQARRVRAKCPKGWRSKYHPPAVPA